MPRFFVPPEVLRGNCAVLTGEQAAHAKVLRLSPGETVTLCDGAGWESRAAVEGWESGGLRLLLEPPAPSRAEPRLRVSVYMGFPKADKLEHVIQKATELGAYEVVAFPCARSVSRPDEKSLASRLRRRTERPGPHSPGADPAQLFRRRGPGRPGPVVGALL